MKNRLSFITLSVLAILTISSCGTNYSKKYDKYVASLQRESVLWVASDKSQVVTMSDNGYSWYLKDFNEKGKDRKTLWSPYVSAKVYTPKIRYISSSGASSELVELGSFTYPGILSYMMKEDSSTATDNIRFKKIDNDAAFVIEPAQKSMLGEKVAIVGSVRDGQLILYYLSREAGVRYLGIMPDKNNVLCAIEGDLHDVVKDEDIHDELGVLSSIYENIEGIGKFEAYATINSYGLNFIGQMNYGDLNAVPCSLLSQERRKDLLDEIRNVCGEYVSSYYIGWRSNGLSFRGPATFTVIDDGFNNTVNVKYPTGYIYYIEATLTSVEPFNRGYRYKIKTGGGRLLSANEYVVYTDDENFADLWYPVTAYFSAVYHSVSKGLFSLGYTSNFTDAELLFVKEDGKLKNYGYSSYSPYYNYNPLGDMAYEEPPTPSNYVEEINKDSSSSDTTDEKTISLEEKNDGHQLRYEGWLGEGDSKKEIEMILNYTGAGVYGDSVSGGYRYKGMTEYFPLTGEVGDMAMGKISVLYLRCESRFEDFTFELSQSLPEDKSVDDVMFKYKSEDDMVNDHGTPQKIPFHISRKN